MTDDPFAPDGGPTADRPDDELVSAYLDDEVTAEERAIVEGDAALRDRVAEFAAARDALRQITPLAHEARDEMLATVLRRLDQPVAPVVPVRRRRGRFDATKGLAVAAAVVMIGLLGFALALADSEGGDDGDSASTREEASITMADDDAGGEGADRPATEASPDDDDLYADDGGSNGPLTSEERLGDFSSTKDLQAAARAAMSAFTEAQPTSGSDDSGEAADSSACGPAVGTRLRATLDGRPVLVDVPDDLAADIIVRDEATCDLITSFAR